MKEGKYRKVYDYLVNYIDENKYSTDTKLPSENVLSNRLSVSRETVRKAIRQLVEDGLVYSFQGQRTFFDKVKACQHDFHASVQGRKVAVILQGIDKEANSLLLKALHDILDGHGIILKAFYTGNRFSNERQCLLACRKGIDGIVIDGVKSMMTTPNLDIYSSLYFRNIPFIFYNNYYGVTDYPMIINDDIKCADELVRRLAENGHRHIAGIFLADNYQGLQKCRGFLKAIIKYGCVLDDGYVRLFMTDDMVEQKSLERKLWSFIKGNPKCTAIACCNIMLYKSLKKVLEGHGMSIPRDISAVCYDYSGNDYVSEGIVCSINQSYQMGVILAEQLFRMISDPDYKNKDYSYTMSPLIYDGGSIRNLLAT